MKARNKRLVASRHFTFVPSPISFKSSFASASGGRGTVDLGATGLPVRSGTGFHSPNIGRQGCHVQDLAHAKPPAT